MKTLGIGMESLAGPAVIRPGSRRLFSAGLILLAGVLSGAEASAQFIPKLVNSSTIPSNGDLNPYGVAFVPAQFPTGGTLAPGDVLVSNFNNSGNLQGLGTTLVKLTPTGPIAVPNSAVTFFASAKAGLTTALGVLKGGYVIVGNVPTTDGTFGTIGQGSLQVLDRNGTVVQTWADASTLDGPWDLAIDDRGSTAHVFVSNVLNGTVTRLDISVDATSVTLQKDTLIATGYSTAPNAAALILGPTGLAFDPDNSVLYVASTADNAVYGIADADDRTAPVVRGTAVFSGSQLRGPLALRFAPNGDLLAANGDAVNADPLHPSEIVEFTRKGQFVREYNVDASQGGAFGLDTVLPRFGLFDLDDFGAGAFNFAVIDDVTNSLSVYKLQ